MFTVQNFSFVFYFSQINQGETEDFFLSPVLGMDQHTELRLYDQTDPRIPRLPLIEALTVNSIVPMYCHPVILGTGVYIPVCVSASAAVTQKEGQHKSFLYLYFCL